MHSCSKTYCLYSPHLFSSQRRYYYSPETRALIVHSLPEEKPQTHCQFRSHNVNKSICYLPLLSPLIIFCMVGNTLIVVLRVEAPGLNNVRAYAREEVAFN